MAKKFSFTGIKRIEIPKTDLDFNVEDFGLSILVKYMPSILSTHKQNSEKIEYLWNYKNGIQDILEKQRPFLKSFLANNIVIENHASRQVDFKTALATSERRDYTIKPDVKNSKEIQDDITYFYRYQTDTNFYGKDKDLKEWIFTTGIGITYTCPRTDIITQKDGIYNFATLEDGYDINSEAPFEFNTLSPIDNFVVYSSSRNKQPLFCVSIVEVEKDETANVTTINKQKEIHIETRYASFILNSTMSFGSLNNYNLEKIKIHNYLPMIEYSANISRIGIIEKNKELFDSINSLVSTMLDIVVDGSNLILIFKNTDVDKKTIENMKDAGALIINDNPAKQNSVADVDTLKISVPIDSFNVYYEQRIKQADDIVGVASPSGQVTSGGDTGQARLLGGGWNNAYTIILNEINSFLIGDYEELKLILYICNLFPDNPINKLKASMIDIKYRINQNDNFLVKAQGIMNLYTVNMPKEEILKASGLFSDVGAVAKKWQENDDMVNEQKNKTTSISETKLNNNSQE